MVTLGKRKRGGRSTAGQGRKKMARTGVASAMTRKVANAVHSFKRQATFTINGNAAYAPYLAAHTYRLSDMPNSSEFSALFDSYRITHTQLKFYLTVDPAAQASASAIYPRLFWAQDQNDTGTPASLDELRQRSNLKVKVLTPFKPVVVNVKPNTLCTTRVSGAGDVSTIQRKAWLSTTVLGADYMGLKFAIDNLTNTNYSVIVERVYWFQCKNIQ